MVYRLAVTPKVVFPIEAARGEGPVANYSDPGGIIILWYKFLKEYIPLL